MSDSHQGRGSMVHERDRIAASVYERDVGSVTSSDDQEVALHWA